jgi:SAM-dependent methyltransferase
MTLDRDEDFGQYFSGARLYGDDFDSAEIERWYADEEDGYSGLVTERTSSYSYVYHALNRYHGYSRLAAGPIEHALSFGGAYGEELVPVCKQIERITILEPSDVLKVSALCGRPVTYVKAVPDGSIPFPDSTFDLITCFGVLHHIPNVSFVIRELQRVLRSDGTLLLREPVTSMGDWRMPRPGLTWHERGIPLELLSDMFALAGLKVRYESVFGFRPIAILAQRLGIKSYNSGLLTRVDATMARLFRWNYRYHATTSMQKLRPTSAYFDLEKTDRPLHESPARTNGS